MLCMCYVLLNELFFLTHYDNFDVSANKGGWRCAFYIICLFNGLCFKVIMTILTCLLTGG